MFDKSDIHMGHLFLDCLKKRPDAICHIDAATGEEETNASVLKRTIHLSRCFKKLGLVPGDVLALGGRNHINLHIPYYAAIVSGLPIAGVDLLYKLDEVKTFFKVTAPKIAFCEPEHYDIYVQAASDLGLDTKVLSFGTGENSMHELLECYEDDTPIEEFKVATIDQDKVYAWLVSTGGTTGVIKVAAIKHYTLQEKLQNMFETFSRLIRTDESAQPNKSGLNLSAVQWVSGFFSALSKPLMHQTKIQTSAPFTVEHVIDIINKYRPVSTLFGAYIASAIVQSDKACDLTCFDIIILTGGKVFADIVLALKKRLRKDALLLEAYGQTENLGFVFIPDPFGPIGGCGRPYPNDQAKLVDPETGKEITEPNIPGELLTKSLCFSEYYNNPEETAKAFTEDGWYRTGDILYRDETNNYFFVERLNMLIKCRNYDILPSELEQVIHSHEGVLEVSVTSIPHAEDREHAVACVVRRPGATVSAQEIKDLVAVKLSETKQLRGGVIFMDNLPMTSSGKVARAKLKQVAFNSRRE